MTYSENWIAYFGFAAVVVAVVNSFQSKSFWKTGLDLWPAFYNQPQKTPDLYRLEHLSS
jgi:hypothetical protein